MAPFPPKLTFDEEPSAQDLAVIVGPDFAASDVRWDESVRSIRIGPPRIPLLGVSVFLFVFAGALTAAPWVLPMLGVELPPHLSMNLVIGLIVGMWLVIVPSLLVILRFVDRAAASVGPGAIIDKHTLELELPWIGCTVPQERIVRFVELNGPSQRSGDVSTAGQYCVLFEDEDGRFVYAPFARLTTRLTGKTAVDRVAELYGVRVQRIRAKKL